MIALGCDHGGFELMQEVKRYLEREGLEYQDFQVICLQRKNQCQKYSPHSLLLIDCNH